MSFTGSYSENFDSMGTSGIAPPLGWAMKIGPSGTSNSTWTTTIPDAGVAALVNTSGSLTATNAPTATNNNGYNAGAPGNASDRVLATSPTTVSGAAIELQLTNNTGSALSGLSIAYDTQRFTSVSSANQLPGYWLFYSLNGTSWTNVSALNPDINIVPNTVGVTSVTSTLFSLASSWANGANLYLRWVDDNAQQTSPDQIIGLNNFTFNSSPSSVPEPSAFSLIALGIGCFWSVRCRANFFQAEPLGC